MDIANNNRQCKHSCANNMLHNISNGWAPHPAAQIMIWICLTVLAQGLHGVALPALGVSVLALSLVICATRLFTLLRRTRWILFSLLLIYGFVTQGHPCWSQLGVFSPSCEGMMDGMLQLMRLLILLAGLAILFTMLSTTQLISGIYTLTYPLRYLGMSRERIAVRIALTLGYAESAMHNTAQDWRASINTMNQLQPPASGSIELQNSIFTLRDWFAVIATSAAVLGILL